MRVQLGSLIAYGGLTWPDVVGLFCPEAVFLADGVSGMPFKIGASVEACRTSCVPGQA